MTLATGKGAAPRDGRAIRQAKKSFRDMVRAAVNDAHVVVFPILHFMSGQCRLRRKFALTSKMPSLTALRMMENYRSDSIGKPTTHVPVPQSSCLPIT